MVPFMARVVTTFTVRIGHGISSLLGLWFHYRDLSEIKQWGIRAAKIPVRDLYPLRVWGSAVFPGLLN